MPSDQLLARTDLPFRFTLYFFANPYESWPYLICLHHDNELAIDFLFRDYSTAEHYFNRLVPIFRNLGQFFSELDTFFRLMIDGRITDIYISNTKHFLGNDFIEFQVSLKTTKISFIIKSDLSVKSLDPSKTDPNLTVAISDLVSDHEQTFTDLFSTLLEYAKYWRANLSKNI